MKRINQQIRERIVHNILSKYAKENGLVKYEYPDGFYVFGNPDSQDLADKKHEEWIENNKKVQKTNGITMERICGNCIHFDLCESEFSFSNANPDDPACDDFVEDEGYSDEIYKRGERIGNPTNRDYFNTDIKLNKEV